MLTETNEKGGVTTYTYDALGNVLTVTDPMSNVVSNTYDLSGRTLSTTDARGSVIQYEWYKGNIVGDVRLSKNSKFGYNQIEQIALN